MRLKEKISKTKKNDVIRQNYKETNSWDWKFGLCPEFTNSIDWKFDWGLVDLNVSVEKGKSSYLKPTIN